MARNQESGGAASTAHTRQHTKPIQTGPSSLMMKPLTGAFLTLEFKDRIFFFLAQEKDLCISLFIEHFMRIR